ncbi:MAG: GNAT family N-acetyltransferase [Acidobacteria bacterium]|nr:GNAT family N-acetyltransferase [Acidobacteriota bacterium]
MNLQVRPFETKRELEAMIDYFLETSDADLVRMGIDLDLVPTREEWLSAVVGDADLPDTEANRFYVGWHLDGRLVGHSSISHIVHGETAHCHLHLWEADLRGAGIGPRFLARSVDTYFDRFDLKLLASEPHAHNPAPNAALPKLGFRLVRRYRTRATSMSGEIEVSRYEITRDEWAALRKARSA